MTVYIVFYWNGYDEVWCVGNVYLNKATAQKEADEYNGYVLTRTVC